MSSSSPREVDDENEVESGIPPLSSVVRSEGKLDSDKDAIESTSTRSLDEKRRFAQVRSNEFARKFWTFITWTPKRCRWDPENPPKFSMALNLLFGFVSNYLNHFSFAIPWIEYLI